ncbi:glycosyltransferase family 4 protein [Halobaculum sp. EA56]|uniref:glycosyltransferase family 4 protein n=1 Tax=Halobaculum sp. EA56 TaxID=3421648 RepID=UPI003EBF2A33
MAGLRSSKIVTPLERSGADVVTIDVKDDLGLVKKYASLVVSVRSKIINEDPDVILTKGTSLGFVSLLVAAPYRIPVVPRVAGDLIRQHKNDFWENLRAGQFFSAAMALLIVLLHWLVVWFSPGVIVVSEHVAETLRSSPGLSGVQYAVVPVPKDVTPFLADYATTPPAAFSTDWTILTVTNLEFKGKFDGLKLALPAIYSILDKKDNCEYVVAGSGRYKNRVESYADKMAPNDDVRDRIKFLGYVEDVDRLYLHADLFLYISLEDGYPNVILEAMAAGLPIVGNPSVGIDEQITNGETGILVDSQREEDLQAAIEGLFEDPLRYERLGERARETVHERNSHESIGEKLINGLSDILTSVHQ